ncbi:hypothetical protein V6N11_027612 [Hibiscus sabdariffa]|uniref:Uncharacterized protein n=1 Tax=Hibiscus sabdariffa TaxID=183260 RepID=A0ABR1ZNQ6_9ROSI
MTLVMNAQLRVDLIGKDVGIEVRGDQGLGRDTHTLLSKTDDDELGDGSHMVDVPDGEMSVDKDPGDAL